MRIAPIHPLTNYKLLDDVFSEFAGWMKIRQLQEHLLQHPLGEHCPAGPEGDRRNCCGNMLFYVQNGAFTSWWLLSWLRIKKSAPIRSRRYRNEEFKRENAETFGQ